MSYNSRKNADGAGAAFISPTSLSWTTDPQPQHGVIDPAHMNKNSYYRVHPSQPEYYNTGTSSQPVPSDSIIQTGPGQEYDGWAAGLPESSSSLPLSGAANGTPRSHVFEDKLLSSRFQAAVGDSDQDLMSLLHQDRWRIPEFSANAGLDTGLTEHFTDFMAPGPSSSTTYTHAGAGVVSTEPRPSSEVRSVSSHDSLRATLDTSAEDSTKKRKVQILDLESDAEDGPRGSKRSSKKFKAWNHSPVLTADSDSEDIDEGSSVTNTKQIAKQKTKQSKRLSSRDYRKRTSGAIASLRERVFPGSVKKGTRRPRVAAGEKTEKDETSETSELDVILEACKKIDDARTKIEQLEGSNRKLKNSHKQFEDYIKELEARNQVLEDDIKILNDGHAAGDRRAVDNYEWLFDNLDFDEVGS